MNTILNKFHMIREFIYRQLEHPWLYYLAQMLLAPGAEDSIAKTLKRLHRQLAPAECILDVGCGPKSQLWKIGVYPVGLDISATYIATFCRDGPGVLGSADTLPFNNASFDSVWCIGLLHHVSDDVARQTVEEMVRVCRPGGYVVIFDAVMPDKPWKRPMAYWIRRLDRGKFVRRENEFKNILPSGVPFFTERISFSLNGLEAIVCIAEM